MSRLGVTLVGALLGAAVVGVYAYLLGPAPGTTYDTGYRSRLDDALEQGQRAADAKESELRARFAQLRSGAAGASGPAPLSPTPPAA